MKTIIYYFTGTGNNLAIARGLQRELGNTTISPIAALLNYKEISEEYNMIGFCSPSYYSHVPPFVTKCLAGVKYKENQTVFSVIGCGGNRGHAVEDIRETVKAIEIFNRAYIGILSKQEKEKTLLILPYLPKPY